MQANLEIANTLRYKHILLRKLSYAVTGSILSQFIILILYIFGLHFSIFAPLETFVEFLQIFASFSTWLYLIPFLIIIFAQSLICAKDYIVHAKYCSTRFQKFKSIFSSHNIVLLTLHVLIGFIVVWLFLAFDVSPDKICEGKDFCINENTFYLQMLGAWAGLNYFLRFYTSDKKIMFPVAQQKKLLQFKSKFLDILRESKSSALWPTLYFVTLYFIFGTNVRNFFTSIFIFKIKAATSSIYIYLWAWIYSTLIYFYLNLMTFFFELFLTEPLQFPIVAVCPETSTLSEATTATIPIIQHLACYDLFILSGNSKARREALFTLSQPGGHPHNWNNLIDKLLKIIKEYTDVLNKSTNTMLVPERPKAQLVIEPNPLKTANFDKIRNMSIPQEVTIKKVVVEERKVSEAVNKKLESLKERLGINFVFGELPEANIQKCLGEGQVIMWIAQSLSSLCVSSLKEDKYGIVQKDLPVIICSLVELKLSVEKLNRIPALNRKGPGLDDFNYKMKLGIISAVKRSLFNICNYFGPYLKDLNLRKEVFLQLNGFVQNKC